MGGGRCGATVNENAVGPKVNPFHELYWQQFPEEKPKDGEKKAGKEKGKKRRKNSSKGLATHPVRARVVMLLVDPASSEASRRRSSAKAVLFVSPRAFGG